MARQTGKYAKLLIATSKTLVSTEVATLNAAPVVIGGITYAINQVATLANKFVEFDTFETPLTIVLAKGSGSDIPTDISWDVDYINGRIIFHQALTAGNTVTVTYYKAGDFIYVGEATEWNTDVAPKNADVTGFNDEWEVFLPTQKGWTGSMTGALNQRIWEAAIGATDSATNTATQLLYIKFYINRAAASSTNPYNCGQGIVSFALKTPYNGKVEFTANIQGSGALARLTA
jgi:hypothetical protein